MNKFELFSLIYYVLDAAWDDNKDPLLGEYLSGANPFLFKDIGSADPAIFSDFSNLISCPITVGNSYRIAADYIEKLGNDAAAKAFSSISEKEWIECVNDYLSKPHKGR